MISQQRKKQIPETEFETTAKHATSVMGRNVQSRNETVADLSQPLPDGIASDIPIPSNRRHAPLLEVKNLGHPIILRADERSTTIHPIRISHHAVPASASIRSFIGGLSHCYNNMLMGIWGNASLIGMVLEKSDPFQSWLVQLEDLIQNGSNLMQLLFGYIAERRAAARRIRLKQLGIELNVYHKNCGRGDDFRIVEECLWELSHTTTRVQMAASIARVIDRMQFLLQQKRSSIDDKAFGSAKAANHLDKIDSLIERGFRLLLNLQYYACVRVPVKKPVCLSSLLQRKADEIIDHHPNLKLTCAASSPLPRIDVDPHQVDHAVGQLLSNAIQDLEVDGKVELEVNTMYSEAPQDRCGVHMLKDYVVLTVKNSGRGMTTSFQSKIFEPFFTGARGQGRSGLGLSAAAGIIRAHGGYIQVMSKVDGGSSFKIYLPLA